MELFFDLVYVFAIIQLSEELYEHLSVIGGVQTGIVFLAVWWAWNYTSWATNWIDPERPAVIGLVAALSLISLVMASALPAAFGGRGATFAFAYVGLQVLRTAFVVGAFGLRDRMGRNYAQLLAWSLIAGTFWIAGGLVHDHTVRLLLWIAAAALDLGAPLHGYRLPGVRPTPMSAWTLAGEHLAERCQLVLMIAFGETVLRLGLTFTQERDKPAIDLALLTGFALVFALWGVYFLRYAHEGTKVIAEAAGGAAKLGRSGYAYAHALMVGGVIVLAVAVHLALADPTADAAAGFVACCVGGPVLYLLGIALFAHVLDRDPPRSLLLAALLLAVLACASIPGGRIAVLAADAIGALIAFAGPLLLRSS
jgi:low temperature requirement protein LtrA